MGGRATLRVTPAGQELIREVAPGSQAVYAELEARYGRERIERLLDMLEELGDVVTGDDTAPNTD